MIDNDQLPLEIVWGEPGSSEENHLSEIARTAIADGQMSIIPEVALAHLHECEACTVAIGEAAMLSARVGSHWNEVGAVTSNEHVAVPVPAIAAAQPEVRLPWLAIAAALVVAGLAALPSLAGASLWYEQTSRILLRAIPHLVRGIVKALQGGNGAPLVVSYASAVLLLIAGITVGVRAPGRARMAAPQGHSGASR
ncbi:hypothetical protein LVJ94_44355 [Pendulispora rubella]|uniref:Zinc-finger domain-containing protein n=1 Tax=Pendulispora rubella TaxID=2741070 RepID=A0ABZ2L1S2_9BACT